MNEDKLNQLRQALELTPENNVIRRMYADLLIDSGELEEAENQILELLRTETNKGELQLDLARIYLKMGKISQGIVLLEDITSQKNASVKSMELLIQFYEQEGNTRMAREVYRKIRANFPGHQNEEIDELFADLAEEEEDDELDDRIRLGIEGDFLPDVVPMEKPDINFSDVGGMKKVKEDIAMKIINPLKNAELFARFGKKIGGGILLYGPPGCGKTYIAKATAGEIDASFISIGINDVMDMYLGQSEKQLHNIFEYARQNAPCVVFFDEVDALGANRNDMRNSAGRNIINQFLQELDGVNTSNEGILILGATNAPWYMDNAFKRPGRFDRIIFVPPPDEEARAEILEVLIKNKPQMEADLRKVASMAKDFTGADLKALVENTIEDKLNEILSGAKETPINSRDFKRSLKSIRPSAKEWFETARNYAIYSNQGGLYDDILKYLNIK